MMNLKYKALTTKTLDNTPVDDFNNGTINEDVWLNEKYEEQYKALEQHGYAYDYKLYEIHFFDSPYTNDRTVISDINDAIQSLAIKDGADLVEYENGNIGFVASYNGVMNGFEIIKEYKERG